MIANYAHGAGRHGSAKRSVTIVRSTGVEGIVDDTAYDRTHLIDVIAMAHAVSRSSVDDAPHFGDPFRLL
jgi:hypothetical protein